MSKTIMQIQEDWQKTELAIYERRFTLAAEAKEFSVNEINQMAQGIIGDIGTEKAHAILTGEADRKAQELRTQARDEYEIAYAAYVDALQTRQAEVEQALFKPARDADPGLLFSVAGASPEKLRSAMELAIDSGNFLAGDIAFVDAYRRGLDEEISYYVDVRGGIDETWAKLFEEFAVAEGFVPVEDISDHFDRIFGSAPAKEELSRGLSASDLARY